MWNRLNAFKKQTYIDSVDQDETPHRIRVCAVCQDKRYVKVVYDQFALIGDKLVPMTIVIANSVKIGFRENKIASTYTFCNVKSRIHQNCDRIFPYFLVKMCTHLGFCVYVAKPLKNKQSRRPLFGVTLLTEW